MRGPRERDVRGRRRESRGKEEERKGERESAPMSESQETSRRQKA